MQRGSDERALYFLGPARDCGLYRIASTSSHDHASAAAEMRDASTSPCPLAGRFHRQGYCRNDPGKRPSHLPLRVGRSGGRNKPSEPVWTIHPFISMPCRTPPKPGIDTKPLQVPNRITPILFDNRRYHQCNWIERLWSSQDQPCHRYLLWPTHPGHSGQVHRSFSPLSAQIWLHHLNSVIDFVEPANHYAIYTVSVRIKLAAHATAVWVNSRHPLPGFSERPHLCHRLESTAHAMRTT